MKFSEKGLRIGFSLILLAFLFWYGQPLEAFAQLIRVAPLMIGISATGFGIIILLNALNGWWLLNGLVPIPFLKMLRYYLYSWVAEFYFPGKLGAFSIAYFLKKENVTVGQSTAIVMLTKLSTVTLAFGLGIAGLATWGWVGGLEHYLMIAGILIIVTFWTFFTKRGRDVVKRIILRHHTGLFIGFGGLVQRLGRNPL
ncbi:MAG: lysylphosphatidylglycerol synthase domain-containing protein, partial [archaeon]|nr:lysylphosphatidylglycerol synthase domain-containing protein [archaeon]